MSTRRKLGSTAARLPIEKDGWVLGEDDMTLYALLTDAVYMPELIWKDPGNRQYAGCYRVRDYQYRLNRCESNYAIFACARSVGKTESEKVHAERHVFDGENEGQNMLITAPELIHLLPLTDAIEDHIRETRLLREFLDLRHGKTGFTHRPFGVNFRDGTKIVGRIPKKTGTGVKGQHQPFLIVEEGQDYPEKGWKEVEETVNYDATDRDGNPRWRYWTYGVHSGDRTSGFATKAGSQEWELVHVTQLMRPDWGPSRKANAIAAYGGSSSPDYRRNILGEMGDAASPYFVTARLMACIDQQVERGEQKGSDYNTLEYVHQKFRWEELDSMGVALKDMLDLPNGYSSIYCGMDIGLTRHPTVILVFTEQMVGRKLRLKLLRRFTIERFPVRQIREAMYAIAWHFGTGLMGFGVDSTGMGLPVMQEIESDELVPPHLLEVLRGYFFNSKVPVGVAEKDVYEDQSGVLRDQYGNFVKREIMPDNSVRFVVLLPFITASTNHLVDWVDHGKLLLPFDQEITKDFMGETKSRVESLVRAAERGGGLRKPDDAFHILDAARVFGMAYHASSIEEVLATPAQKPVLDYAGF